jgi:membrane protease YdiL (CAAX protease family)
MLGALILTGVSWLLFSFVLKKNFFQEWFSPLSEKVIQIFIGIVLAIVAFIIPITIKTAIYSIEWSISENLSIVTLFEAFYFYLKSVLFEELVFRGALLSLLIVYIKERNAVLISAIVFGIYHWFSYGMIGSGLVPMTYVFIVTGSMGWVWAYIYSKTNSIVMPVAIHLAWNFTSSLVLDYNPFGELLLSSSYESNYSEIIDFLIQFGGELLSVLLIVSMFTYYHKKSRINNPAF